MRPLAAFLLAMPVVLAPRPTPAQCTQVAYGIGEASAGWMTLKTDGSVWLAEQSMTKDPVSLKARKVVSLGNEVVAIGENDGESGTYCAVKGDRSLWCWGQSDTDQVGNGLAVYYQPEPVMVLADVKQVANSAEFTCATRMDGTVWCWGRNAYGQLGTGDLTDRPMPAQVPGLADVDVVSAGFEHTCALTTAGELLCWGGDTYGEVGVRDDISTPMSFTSPQLVSGISGAITGLSAGGFYTMVVTEGGQVWAWGANGTHQLALGDGDTADRSRPVQHPTLTAVASVDTGVQHGCAVDLAGAVWCWGRNVAGELGDGTTSETDQAGTPRLVVGPPGVRSVHVVDRNVCAVGADDSLWCWGSGGFMDASGASALPRRIDYCDYCEPADCGGACLDGACQACRDDADCADPANAACDLATGACRPCGDNVACPDGQTCDLDAEGGAACVSPGAQKPQSSCSCQAGARGGGEGAALLLGLAVMAGVRRRSWRWWRPRGPGRRR